ncbi:MAG: Gfo/Idh/MocA family oxidoreductase [Thermoguttaceae bacterium]|jgi:predicted dehydrogenase
MKQYRSSRRDFLKTSAVAAGAAATTLGIARSAHAAGSDVLKIALIGCGGRGTGAAVNCLNVQKILGQKIQIVALADAFEDRAKGCLSQLKRESPEQVNVTPDRVFVGLDAYQKAINSGVDFVLLATPPGFRPQHYAAAIAAGKHVFMEKPCCTDAPGYRSLIETNKLADAKGLKVVVGLQRRHESGYLHGVQKIHDGELGKIQFLRVFWNGSGGGARDLGARPQNDPREMEFQVRNWGCFVWLYGDNIVEQHVHNIDIANWVMCRDGNVQNAHPVEANGMGGRVNGGNYGDIFDHHFIEFTYGDGTKVYSQSRHIDGTWDQVAEFAHGDKGTRYVAQGGGPNLESGNPYDQEHVDLVKAILKNTKLNDGWHGAVSSMTAVFGRMATYSGQIVRWDDAVAKGPNEGPERIAFDALPRHLPGSDGRYPFPTPGNYKAY